MRKWIMTVAVIVAILCLSACANSKVTLDYGDAASFEAALNAGENLEGKTVQFIAGELHPDSAFGYNVWAGEHLNFVSSRNPDIQEGDTVSVKATEITSTLGSWVIKYEKIENAELGDTTIVSTNDSNSDTQSLNGAKSSSSGSGDFNVTSSSTSESTTGENSNDDSATHSGTQSFSVGNSGGNNSEQPLELKDYGWFLEDPTDDTGYVSFCGMIYNPNESLIAEFPKLTVTVKNANGDILATETQVGSIVMPEDTVTLCGMLTMPLADLEADANISFSVISEDFSVSSTYQKARSTDFVISSVSEHSGDFENYITGEITNNYNEKVSMVNLSIVLRKSGEIVYIENTFLNNLNAGETRAFEFSRYHDYPDHDTIDISAMVW